MKVELALDLFGVDVRIGCPEELADGLRARLAYAEPIIAETAREASRRAAHVELVIDVSRLGGGEYMVSRDGEELLKVTASGAIDTVETQVRQQVSFRSPEMIFLHAGVVGWHGHAILIPGLSHSGKTTLVAELVRAGASYLSDEYAVLDADGIVHPFLKPLSVRSAAGEQELVSIEAIGGHAAASPLPVGLVVLSTYRNGAGWEPERLSGGDAVLRLLRHTAQIRPRPAESLGALRRVVERAPVLTGERGEAADLVPILLQTVGTLGH